MRTPVVEDEVRIARHVSRALTTSGHDVVVVHDGEAALREAKATRYELIVLDVMLPGIDGFEVLSSLRKARVDSLVLILTARGELNLCRIRFRPCSPEPARPAGQRRSDRAKSARSCRPRLRRRKQSGQTGE